MWIHTLYCILLLFLAIESFRVPTFSRLVVLKRRNTSFQAVKVALTREKDTNGKLASLLNGLQCIEIPCIAFSKTEEFDTLQDYIPKCDLILLTSPQSSDVFLESWKNIGSPPVKVVSIGKGTSKPLVAEGIEPVFEPSDSTGSTLAAELPDNFGKTILYPVSALADANLQTELTKRGFEVTRVNSYTTIPAEWSEKDEEIAKSVDIVTLASPSAVKIWAERVGNHQIAVTIGPTSEKAAKAVGFSRIFSPPEGSKGIDVWADLIKEVAIVAENKYEMY